MYYVYILQSQKDFGFYTGLTENISRRLREHNSGQVKATKARAPFVVIYTEIFDTSQEARVREKFFKTGAGREFRDRILDSIPR